MAHVEALGFAGGHVDYIISDFALDHVRKSNAPPSSLL